MKKSNSRIDFTNWTDEVFGAWLAGFFDGEGCIYVPKYGVEVSISNTCRAIITAIYRRVGFGELIETRFDQEKWKIKYTIRWRNYGESQPVLLLMRPYLTIKAKKADLALDRIAKFKLITEQRIARNLEMVRLRESGLKHREIAVQLKTSRTNVSQILRWLRTHGNVPQKRDRKMWIVCNQKHKKSKVYPKTSTRRLKRAA